MRILSGIQPSGIVHIGNYLGAMRQQIALQDQGDHEHPIYLIVDLHAITVPQEPAKLREHTLNTAALYLALGLDPEKAILYVQSQRPEHAELAWILTTITSMGELERMTQFKEKGRGEDRGGSGVGLFSYPLLMAADILLYNTQKVPIGEDQVQHLELARDLAKRFNQRFGDTVTIPEPILPEHGARIMGLDDPSVKMSKSASSAYNYIALTDDADTVRNKIKKAVTDSGSEIVYSNEKPALKNLLTIFAGVTSDTPEVIASRYAGKGYADFKADLAEAITAFLAPIQARYAEIRGDEQHLTEILRIGARRAEPLAKQTMHKVKNAVGFVF